MTESKHTPSHWYALPYIHPSHLHAKGEIISSYTIEIEETDEYPDTVIGEIYGPGHLSPEMKANARLIAAAPELLEALKDLSAETEDMVEWIAKLNRAKAVIKRAENQSCEKDSNHDRE